LGHVHLQHRRVRIDAGIGDDDGDRTQLLLGRADERGHRAFVADIDGLRKDAITQRGRRALARRLSEVAERDPRAGGVKGGGDALPDAGAGAGHEYHLFAEIEGRSRVQWTLPPPSTSSVWPDMKSLSYEESYTRV